MSQAAPRSSGFPVDGSVNPGAAASPIVQYALDPDELAESFVYQARRRPAIQNTGGQNPLRGPLFLLALMVAPAFAGALLQLSDGQERTGALYPVYIAIAIWLAVCLFSFSGHARRRTSGKDGYRPYYQRLARDAAYATLLGPYRLELTPERLIHESENRELRIRWGGIKDVNADPSVTYFEQDASGIIAVPRRVFNSDVEYWAFVRLAREYKAAADGKGE